MAFVSTPTPLLSAAPAPTVSVSPGCLPPALRPGARVAIVAPAGPMRSSNLEAGLGALREAGLEVVVPHGLSERCSDDGYLAGGDAVRLGELVAALDDPEVEGIVCVRGGYGAMRLLEGLDAACRQRADMPWRPRRLCGFSDATALHSFWLYRLGWASLHSAMPFNLGANGPESRGAIERSARELVQALQAETPAVGLAPAPALVTVVPGRASGVLVGGNLSLVESLYRSPWLPSLVGCLLLVEDVGEALYRLDRLVTALRLRGAHREVAGVVVADFARCGAPPDAAAAHVAALFADWGVPVARGLDAGHRHPNRALWLGWPHELDAARGELRALPPAQESA